MTNRVAFVNVSKIQELASEKKLSITGLERELKVSHNAINRWKKNGGTASVNTLCIVANYFGVTVDELIEKV